MKTLIASSPIGIRPHLGEAELLVEGDRAVDVADPVAGVEERVGHGGQLILRLMRLSRRARLGVALAALALLARRADRRVGRRGNRRHDIPTPTGKTVTIAVREVGGQADASSARPTVADGDELEIVDGTEPAEGRAGHLLAGPPRLPAEDEARPGAAASRPATSAGRSPNGRASTAKGCRRSTRPKRAPPAGTPPAPPTVPGDSWFSGTEPGGTLRPGGHREGRDAGSGSWTRSTPGCAERSRVLAPKIRRVRS